MNTQRLITATLLSVVLWFGAGYAEDTAPDTTRTGRGSTPSPSVGEVLAEIPKQIVLLPTRIAEGVAIGGVYVYKSPFVRRMFSARGEIAAPGDASIRGAKSALKSASDRTDTTAFRTAPELRKRISILVG